MPCQNSGFTPDVPRQLDNQAKLGFLHLGCHRIAGINAGKSALRAYRQPFKRDVSGRVVDALVQFRLIFK